MHTKEEFWSSSLLFGERILNRISFHPISFNILKIFTFIVVTFIYIILATIELFVSDWELIGVAATIETFVGANMVHLYLKLPFLSANI